ncbi:MAG: TolC family protein [Phycisphaerae bacterium]
MRQAVLWCAVASWLIAGCAIVDPDFDYERVAEHIEKATGQTDVYRPGDEAVVGRHVERLLQDGLTVIEAVQICLLNNPSLQAGFLDVGMARADVVQSGLFSNPSLSVALRLPAGGGLANIDGGIAQNIADLWQIPVRRRAAGRWLDKTILEIARAAADLAADAKVAYYATVSTRQLLEISQENLGIARELLDFAVARQKAGAGTVLDVNLSRSAVAEAELALESARLKAADAARRLATLMGLTTDADALVLVDGLPETPSEGPDPDALIALAWRWRLDLRSARQALSAAAARLAEQNRLIVPSVEVGVALERDVRQRQGGRKLLAETARASIAGGGLTAPEIQPRSERQRNKRKDFIIGPSIGLALPIFDQNQAQIAKASYAHARAAKVLESLERASSQEIRSAVDRARTAWRIVRLYRDRFIPLAQSNLDLSRKSYRVGKTSFLAVLEAQRFFLDSRSRYTEASRSAALMVPELERAVGLPIDQLIHVTGEEPAADVERGDPEAGEEP